MYKINSDCCTETCVTKNYCCWLKKTSVNDIYTNIRPQSSGVDVNSILYIYTHVYTVIHVYPF